MNTMLSEPEMSANNTEGAGQENERETETSVTLIGILAHFDVICPQWLTQNHNKIRKSEKKGVLTFSSPLMKSPNRFGLAVKEHLNS